MLTSMTTSSVPVPGFRSVSNAAIQGVERSPERQHTFIILVALVGIFCPPTLLPLGDLNVTVGRLVVIVLILPAVGLLVTRGRHGVASDFFATALSIWMLASSVLSGGFRPYVGAEALELLGAYLVGRAFVFGPANFLAFIRALKLITPVLVALAVLDIVSGRYITLDSFGVPNSWAERFGWVRAASVFDGAEHYGTFCVAAAAIFLYSEHGIRRVLYVGLCAFGCALSLSSGPLLGFCIVMAVSLYDHVLKRHAWRWKALVSALACIIIMISVVHDHPIEWMLIHFTLDPQTGFFRIETWSAALPIISHSPFTGHGLVELGHSVDERIFLRSVDSLWLLEALRYGVPAVILLIMTMFSPLLNKTPTPGTHSVQTGLSLSVVTIALVGLTVHFWGATWLFLNLCVGIRASLAEYDARRY